jgi:hypothetical protein
MSSSAPVVRASHLKEDLEALSKLGPTVEAAVRARIAPASLALVLEAARSDWLPLAVNVEMAEAVYAEAGAQRVRAWGRESFLVSLTAFFRPLLQAITAIFHPSPAAICRFSPRAWLALYRNCGSLQIIFEAGAQELRIALVDFPEPLRRTPFLTSFAGTFEGVFDHCEYDGKVEMEPAVDGKNPGYVVSWKRRER